jgi:hypothetical protein
LAARAGIIEAITPPARRPVAARRPEVMEFLGANVPEPTGEQGAGVNDYRRIAVQASGLACHDSKASRPAFAKENSTADMAFNFKPGDLRGL